MKTPSLAIVIPFYKITFFEETLQSLANQIDKRFKVYIGNDASPSDPISLVEKYASQIDIAYKKFENNMGSISLTKQWDRCIDLIENEEWIMILGDDDYLDESVVAQFYKQLPVFQDKSQVIRFATKIVFQDTNSLSKAYTHPTWEMASDSYYRKFKEISRSSLSEHIFSKSSYKKYGFKNFNLAWHSDDLAWFDFSENKPIYTINNSFVYIGTSSESVSGSQDNISIKQVETILFLRHLVTKKSCLFDLEKKLYFLFEYEFYIKKIRKLTLEEWSLVIVAYLKIGRFIPILKVIRRFFLSLK